MSEPFEITSEQMEALSEVAVASKGKDRNEISAQSLPPAVQACPRRFIELEYLYADGSPVAGARYVVESHDGEVWYQGTLDAQGRARIDDVPPERTSFYYYFLGDPAEREFTRTPVETPDAKETQSVLDSMLEWIWGTVQGDFNENPSFSQTAVNTILGLIPLVDQVLDLRDIIAGLKNLIEYYCEDEEQQKAHEGMLGLSYETWLWLDLFIIVIGCIPEVGSLVKGIFRALVKFLADHGGKLAGEAIRQLWEYLLLVFNSFGKGNAHTWLKQLPDQLDGWMARASAELKSCLDAIQKMLKEGEDWVNSWAGEWLLEEENRRTFTAGVRKIMGALQKTYMRLDEMEATVNRWLREQILAVLKGRHTFRELGVAGGNGNAIRNVRQQEAVEPPRSIELRQELQGETETMVPAQVDLEKHQLGTPEKPDAGLAPKAGSPEHKQARWEAYLERTGEKGWDYERWSNVYEQNIHRATRAHAATDAYHQTLGWGEREVTLTVGGEARRLDIADVATSRGVEFKTGYQTATAENISELMRDRALMEQQYWKIQWVFEGSASKPLLKALEDAGIPYIMKP